MIAAPTGECADDRPPRPHVTPSAWGRVEVHPRKKMSNVYSDPGYEDLWCLIGNHDFIDGRCKYCERKLRTDENVVMSILPTKRCGPLAANE